MNTAINTLSDREFNRGIVNAALCRVEGRDDEGVIFLDEIGEDGSVIDPAIVAAADRNGMTPAELCELVADAEEDKRQFNELRGYSAAERRTILTARAYGEDDIEIVRGRRTH